jgi:hypothetical protein
MLVFLLLTSALKCTKAAIQGCLYFELAKGPRRVRDMRPVATRLNNHAHDVESVSVVAK